MKARRKKRPTPDQRRIAELEAKVDQLQRQLVEAILQIPNANAPAGGLRPVCSSHVRFC